MIKKLILMLAVVYLLLTLFFIGEKVKSPTLEKEAIECPVDICLEFEVSNLK